MKGILAMVTLLVLANVKDECESQLIPNLKNSEKSHVKCQYILNTKQNMSKKSMNFFKSQFIQNKE